MDDLRELLVALGELRAEVHSLRDEVQALREKVGVLAKQSQRGQEALTRLSAGLLSDPATGVATAAERDAYRTSLYALTRKEVPVRAEDLVPSQGDGPTLEQFIRELEREPGQ